MENPAERITRKAAKPGPRHETEHQETAPSASEQKEKRPGDPERLNNRG